MPSCEDQRCFGDIPTERFRRCFELLTLLANVTACEPCEDGGTRHIRRTATLAELLRRDFHERGLRGFRKIAPGDAAPDEDIDDGLQPLPGGRQNLCGGR